MKLELDNSFYEIANFASILFISGSFLFAILVCLFD